jgi:hypothetical protein
MVFVCLPCMLKNHAQSDKLVDQHEISLHCPCCLQVEIAGDCYIVCGGLLNEDEQGFRCVDVGGDSKGSSRTRAARRVLNFAVEMMQVGVGHRSKQDATATTPVRHQYTQIPHAQIPQASRGTFVLSAHIIEVLYAQFGTRYHSARMHPPQHSHLPAMPLRAP